MAMTPLRLPNARAPLRLKRDDTAGTQRLLADQKRTLSPAALALARGDLMRPLGSGSVVEGLARGGEAFLRARQQREQMKREMEGQQYERDFDREKFDWEKSQDTTQAELERMKIEAQAAAAAAAAGGKIPTGMRMGPGGEWIIDPEYLKMRTSIARAGAASGVPEGFELD